MSSFFDKGWRCAIFYTEGKVLLLDPNESYTVLISDDRINSLLSIIDESTTLKNAVQKCMEVKGA